MGVDDYLKKEEVLDHTDHRPPASLGEFVEPDLARDDLIHDAVAGEPDLVHDDLDRGAPAGEPGADGDSRWVVPGYDWWWSPGPVLDEGAGGDSHFFEPEPSEDLGRHSWDDYEQDWSWFKESERRSRRGGGGWRDVRRENRPGCRLTAGRERCCNSKVTGVDKWRQCEL